ncbi:hypothetical protein [Amycolatopsis sp. NPDC049253]|uniref:hypothetical protein n=1 Tax=Amycolatopsis sp. NPDC049253 TaxID=3155274 RepID=UPI00341CF146
MLALAPSPVVALNHAVAVAEATSAASRHARAIMLQIGLSAAIVLTLVPLAAFGVLSLATVVSVHEVAEVFVVGNGVRAGRLRPLRGVTAPEPVSVQQIPAGEKSEEDGCSCCAPQQIFPARQPEMLTLSKTRRDLPPS